MPTLTATEDFERRLQALEDRNSIIELWARYCQLCDAQDATRLTAEIYTPDAVEDYAMGHQTGRLVGHEELEPYFATGLATCESTAHVLGQTWVAVDGDTARGWHYITAYHWLKRADADPMRPADWVAVGTLTDQLRRGSSGWQLVRRHRISTGGAIAVGRPPA